MKQWLLLLFWLIAAVFAHAQYGYLNTKTPYQPQQLQHTPPPAGYVPVFINYTGRHGARFLTSAGDDVLVLNVLQQANNEHALTPLGTGLLNQLQQFDSIEQNNYGSITKLGEQEQHDIAKRLQQEYAPVCNNGKFLIEATEKLRTQQSATAFLSGIGNYDSVDSRFIIFPAAADSILRFYDLSEAYKKYTSTPIIQTHIDSLLQGSRTEKVAADVCKRMFINTFLEQLKAGNITASHKGKTEVITPVSFSQSLYDMYCILFSAKAEMQVNNQPFVNTLQDAFSKADLEWLNQSTSASDFYEKGPGENNNGIQVTIAAPLLSNLINTTDSATTHNYFNAIFRFTHAEAISPLAALMGIPHASNESNSVFTFSNKWNASQIIPLSANMQWILYSNHKNFLLKVLLNEREVRLPIPVNNFPYYNWGEVKQYFNQKLSIIKPDSTE